MPSGCSVCRSADADFGVGVPDRVRGVLVVGCIVGRSSGAVFGRVLCACERDVGACVVCAEPIGCVFVRGGGVYVVVRGLVCGLFVVVRGRPRLSTRLNCSLGVGGVMWPDERAGVVGRDKFGKFCGAHGGTVFGALCAGGSEVVFAGAGDPVRGVVQWSVCGAR